MAWDIEREQKLRVLWLAGLSVSSIAVRLQVTRNTVIGKADRLKLPRHVSVGGGDRGLRQQPWPEPGTVLFANDPRAIRDHGSPWRLTGAPLTTSYGCVTYGAVAGWAA